MKDEINKIISWIEMSYTRLNYKEELSLVDYIKQLQQENKHLKEHIENYCKTTGIKELMENKKYKEVIDKAINYIYDEIKREGFHHYLDDKDIEELLDILKEVE